MSGYKNFAVVGAGKIGEFIVDELLNLKASGAVSSVVVVSRTVRCYHPEWASKGAKFASIDYNSPSTITSAFANIDVVISTVGIAAIVKQVDLAIAAKSASVKLFVPSQFGTPMTGARGPFAEKEKLQNKLKDLGLPYALFFTGPSADLAFIAPLGWDLANGKVHIGGDGNAPISFTSRLDIARYLGHVLTTLPVSRIEWRTFSIEGDRLSFNEVASGYQAKTGKNLEVTYTSQTALKQRLSDNPQDFLALLQLAFDQGEGISGKELDNNEWPEWNPKKVLDIIA